MISKDEMSYTHLNCLVKPIGYQFITDIINSDPNIGVQLIIIDDNNNVIPAHTEFPPQLDLPLHFDIKQAMANCNILGGEIKNFERLQRLVLELAMNGLDNRNGLMNKARE
jgi:hypothetical protein